MALTTTVKSIQDIMRKDVGVDGDAQRIGQLVWLLFLKIWDDREQELELMESGFASPLVNITWSENGEKKRAKDPNAPPRAPSGFNKPGPLSKELCKFLKVPENTELSRPDVTKRLTTYIKEHGLQNEANKREILPDKKLAKLLTGPTDGTALTFFNLQKYIKQNFGKQ